MKKAHIILTGWGTGERLLTEALQAELNLSRVAINEVFREVLQERSSLAEEVLAYMDKGELVPDMVVNKMLGERIDSIHTDLLMVRYPRTKGQYESLNELLIVKGFKIEQIWLLKIKDIEQLIEYKQKKEKDNPYTLKYGLNPDELRERYLDSIRQFEEIKEAVSDQRLITTIAVEYPVENSETEIKNIVKAYAEGNRQEIVDP